MKEKIAAFSRKYVDEFIPNYLSSAILPFFYFCSLSALAYVVWEQPFGNIIFMGALLTVVGLLSLPIIIVGVPMVMVRNALNPPRPMPSPALENFGRGTLDVFKGSLSLIILGLIAITLGGISIALLGFGFGIILNEKQLGGLYFFFFFWIMAVMATRSSLNADGSEGQIPSTS